MKLPMPDTLESPNPVPDVVVGYLSVRSPDGTPLLEADSATLLQVDRFYGSDEDVAGTTRMAEEAGLTVLAASRLGVAVSGPPGAFLEITGGEMVTRERLVRTRAGRIEYVTHLDILGDDQPGEMGVAVPSSAAAPADAVVLERPKAPLAAVFPAPFPPAIGRYHLRVPDDVATILGAAEAHRAGHVGDGVVVAMVDTGQFQHPFFAAHGYAVRPPVAMVAGTSPARDPYGHGTGESANIFAVAPGATLHPYRASNDAGALVAGMAGFVRAKEDLPDVLTNSWSSDYDYPPGTDEPPAAEKALVLEILDAIARNIVVVFSAGNGHFGAEAQVPGVIAAGGVYATAGLELQASNYSSGYASPWFGGVQVPTVSGVVGMAPRAALLALPVPPGSILDRDCATEIDGEPGDGTTVGDGWALFSGTSAAAPQVAGAAAVLRGVRPGATPAQVAQALISTAVDVEAGRCNARFNNSAARGRDLATGAGLIHVSRAVAALQP